jgi:threonine aldolase
MNVLDLRSDTVTKPTEGMRHAIATAEVGDDVFGDDPTVLLLQERVADLLGKEASLFVPSGTMANQLALRSQTRPGDQFICEAGAHIYNYEGGAPAALSGLMPSCVATPDGILRWKLVEPVLNPDDVHFARPSLVCLENSHNRAGGLVMPQDEVAEIGRQAHARGLRVHLDGARLWNVHIACGQALHELAAPADSVSVCFSKALGAPVGSILAGDRDLITMAHRYRKQFGGGMRQAGILAAACIFALDHHLQRLQEDHARAQRLAMELDNPLLRVDHHVETNIVILAVAAPATAEQLLNDLAGRGILAVGFGPGRVRLIPNLGLNDADIDRVIATLNTFTG